MADITINEVRRRLQAFSKEHENDSDEKQHAQQFWRDFYMCFGLSKSSASMFEARVLKVGGARGYIDSFIPGVLLVEQKSLGRNLDDAYVQAQAYFHAIANEFEIPIIEDAAEAHGQTYFGKPCGSFGELSTFSFYANKHITTGEGGMIVTDDFELAEKCKKLRNLCFEPEKRFIHFDIGWNYRLTNLQAALGLAQLENLDKSIMRKKILGQKYQDLLFNSPFFQTPVRHKDGYDNHYWVFGLVLKPEHKKTAKMIMESLYSEGIGTRPFFWPMHKQPILNEFVDASFSVSEMISEFGFYLPSGVGTTEDEIEIVVSKLKKVLN
jgi:perosamine synthetase